jgi:hypothetical protein
LLAGVGLLGLVGCSGPIGTWELKKIRPPSALDDFHVESVTFKAGEKYTARGKHGDRVEEMSGTYVYDEQAKLLTFHDDSGKQRQYRMEICGSCSELYIWNTGDTERWRATYRRR